MRALLIVLVLSVAGLGHFDHAAMVASAAVPDASGPLQTTEMPCEDGRCADARHCRIAASHFSAALSGQQRDLESPANAIIRYAPVAASRRVVFAASAGVPLPSARLYLTTARLRL